MGKVDQRRVMRMAQGMAEGLTPKAAAVAAGYSPRTNSYRTIVEDENFKSQVEAARLRHRRGGSPDLGPVIDDLMEYAEKAAGLGTGAGMMAAAKLLAEAARLKSQMQYTDNLEPPPPILPRDEWMRLYGAKD
jgi:hypothetical protein